MAIQNISIADNGHLMVVLEDGTVKDAGYVRGIPGPQGEKGLGIKGDPGEPGTPGTPGTGIKGFASGYVNAGTFVTLDNIKVSVTTGGSRGLCMATVTGTMTCSIAGHYMYSYASAEGTATTYPGANYSITPSGSFFNWSFGNAGDTSIYYVNDYTNKRFYRVTLMIGASYLNNFISIERLG